MGQFRPFDVPVLFPNGQPGPAARAERLCCSLIKPPQETPQSGHRRCSTARPNDPARNQLSNSVRVGLLRDCFRNPTHPPIGLKSVNLRTKLVRSRMEESAKVDGLVYGPVCARDITGLDLEQEFSFISQELVRQNLYYDDANLFDWSFTQNQKRLIFYLLSLMSRPTANEHDRNVRLERSVFDLLSGTFRCRRLRTLAQ